MPGAQGPPQSAASAPITKTSWASPAAASPGKSAAKAGSPGGAGASVDASTTSERTQNLLGNLAGSEAAARTAANRATQLFGNFWQSAREQATAVAEAAAAAGLAVEESTGVSGGGAAPLRRFVTGARDQAVAVGRRTMNANSSSQGATQEGSTDACQKSADAMQYFVTYQALDLSLIPVELHDVLVKGVHQRN
eukprot:TRINITY_DN64661_c0_g1_i1.p1 TRINITY_DN64661_c0_g1~~TRINITY_DN64661_c0_g1_i1.p1  ORF type:complete len:194 (-),score=34.35 TRINITY_DN64661_c0_g1_i1:38-619(-)